MRPIEAGLLQGSELYREVILDKLAHARESVDIATSNLKDMHVERDGRFDSALALFSELSGRGVSLRLLHAELPSRPFRASFEKRRRLTGGGLRVYAIRFKEPGGKRQRAIYLGRDGELVRRARALIGAYRERERQVREVEAAAQFTTVSGAFLRRLLAQHGRPTRLGKP